MVKVAASDYPPRAELWNKLQHLNHPKVLRIFRTLEEGGRFFEVQEFCQGGTLADYVPLAGSGRAVPSEEWVEKSLVPAFHAGISYLHDQGIVHRDVKPSNLYLREENGRKNLVIGDFDISSVLQTGRTSRSTQRVAGTWIYSPPEAFPRFIDDGADRLGSAVVRSSDYYSFGVVIVELLFGITSLHQAQLPDLYDFYLQGGKVEIPKGLSPRLSELLAGLLCRNRHHRWGGDEVARWIAGHTSEEDRRRINEDRGYQLTQSAPPFNAFEGSKPTNLSELSLAMEQETKIALEELMGGDVLLNWIGQQDSRLARNIRLDRDKWRRAPRIALLCARLHLHPEMPLRVDEGTTALSAADWARKAQVSVAKGNSAAASLCSQSRLQELDCWLRFKASPDLADAEKVKSIAETHYLATPKGGASQDPAGKFDPAPDPTLILEEISYAFLPSKPYLIAPNVGAQTPRQISRMSLGAVEDWKDKPPAVYLSSLKRWQAGFLEAYLRQRLVADPAVPSPLMQQLEKVRADFSGKPFVAFEVILRLLDPELPPLEIELDPKVLANVLHVSYGDEQSLAIAFRTHGAGMPYAAIMLKTQWEAMYLESHELRYRQGVIKLRVDSKADVPAGQQFTATFGLESQTTKLQGDIATLRYCIDYPKSLTLKRMAIGALIGAGIFGGARLAIMAFIPVALRFEYAGLMGGNAWPVLLLTTLAPFYGAFRLAMWAIAKIAR